MINKKYVLGIESSCDDTGASVIDNEGNIYTAGSCANSNSKFANVTVPATFSYNTYVAKYSPTGVYQWVKFVQDITCPDPQVKAKNQDEVYFSSTLTGAYSFDTITAQGPNGGYDFLSPNLILLGRSNGCEKLLETAKRLLERETILI